MGSNKKEVWCKSTISMCPNHVPGYIAFKKLHTSQDKIGHSSAFPLGNVFFVLEIPFKLKLPFMSRQPGANQKSKKDNPIECNAESSGFTLYAFHYFKTIEIFLNMLYMPSLT